MKKAAIFVIIVLVIANIALLAQTHKISGKVTDESSNPIIGVSVKVKNTTKGTVTDANGYYELEVTSSETVLEFSYIGYKTEEVKISGRSTINVQLVPDLKDLEEVVVVGYGVQKRSNCSGSITYAKCEMAAPSVADQAYYIDDTEFNTEGYSTVHENGFKDVKINPLSTFSIDVDAASYSNLRRYITYNSLPPMDAVRIEEMINYFSYEYPQPTGDVPFSVNHELAPCPWNPENLLLLVGLQGKKIPTENLPASNLVFLIDVSGSMQDENKLPLLVQSFKLLVNELRPQDRISMVVYAGSSGLVLPSTPGNQKETIVAALDKLQAGGSTAGGEGLMLAYKTAEQNFMENGNNRIILATDGDFNVGASSNAEMERLIEEERNKGIFISVLGYGMGNYKDDKMEIIADKGNGNYYYIDNLQEAKKVLVSEFGGTLFTIAKDVKFQLEFNPAEVASYRLIGYENRLLNEEDFNNDKKDAGELGSGHTVTALYEIVPAKGNNQQASIQLKYQNTQVYEQTIYTNELVTMSMRYKKPDEFDSKLLQEIVTNNPLAIANTSNNFRFATSVAEFGMLLRESEFKGSSSFESVLSYARGAQGSDAEGYRAEFIKMVKQAEALKTGVANNYRYEE
jgi:Ca-activated chloride channel homolog